MRRFLAPFLAGFAALLALLLGASRVAGQSRGTPSPETIYARCKPSVVTIMTFDANRAPIGQGSGFIISKNRIVTNYHVVAGSTSASILFSDGSISMVTAVVAGSVPKDLVVLEAETSNRPFLVLGNELELKVGQTIYVIGAPRGLPSSLSNGLVSAFRQDAGQFLIQITASIAPGSSGGPLLNTQGQVVGVTTSRLTDGNFGFAVGAGDVQHLIKAPLTVKLQLSDLPAEDTATPAADLNSVQALFDQKKYDDALASFNALSDSAKASFDSQLLLCRIEQGKKEHQLAIQACDSAIQLQPNAGIPYGVKAYSLLAMGHLQEAEAAASRATSLSDDVYYKNLLALIHYSEEKFDLVPRDLPADSDNTFLLTLLAGAALHNHDYDAFRRFRTRITSLKGPDNGWSLYIDGLAAERELNWDVALDKFKKCDADSDFIDPVCVVSEVQVEMVQANYSSAKTDIDNALALYPQNRDVLAEAIFIYLKIGNLDEADRLHETLKATALGVDDSTDCLYYYGRNQPLLATNHCEASMRAHPDNYVAWSNAGYVALDNADFQSAVSYFAKAIQLFYASKEKHTGTEEVDVNWGLVVAAYYSGDKKTANTLYRAIKKQYPGFVTMGALNQLPLVWSDRTTQLVNRVIADLK